MREARLDAGISDYKTICINQRELKCNINTEEHPLLWLLGFLQEVGSNLGTFLFPKDG